MATPLYVGIPVDEPKFPEPYDPQKVPMGADLDNVVQVLMRRQVTEFDERTRVVKTKLTAQVGRQINMGMNELLNAITKRQEHAMSGGAVTLQAPDAKEVTSEQPTKSGHSDIGFPPPTITR